MHRNFICLLFLLISCQLSRVIGDDECKDVTVGDCELQKEQIILRTLISDASLCQFFCNTLTDCSVFQFNESNSNCTLLKEDYRQECKSSGGPMDKPITSCLEVDLYTCDRIMEENCEFSGDVILELPIGSIADANHCQELCEEFSVMGCNHWSFDINKCTLLSSGERNCTIIGGPKSPSMEECKVTSTTIKTTTTTMNTTTPKTSTVNTTTPATIPTTTIPICSKTTLQIVDTMPLEDTYGNESYCIDVVNKTLDTCSGEEWVFYDNKTLVVQINNTNLPAIGIGSEEVRGVNYNGTFNTTNTDDDWIGIIFGYENSSSFYVMHGAKFNVSNGYYKNQQFKITKVHSDTGVNGPDMKNAMNNATSVPGQTSILWHDDANRGWLTNKEYTWNLKFRPLTGEIQMKLYEDSTLLFDTNKLTTENISKAGRLGVYTDSQAYSYWYDMTYECDDSAI